ncbi:hypothetical protein GCM10025857_35850 [Alicyclobacillus contaminans]|uniref:hypothetical protein n=1 Tax=Alicyclobacillus contaminans TaxID=392016 RepID=UPI0003F6EF0B|nr:hypothetical protein [Alicyclobacillus contaminans]GMA52228.1 hypothetical protein GCM10025857_35850 [Alicyclobacillus contaminans]
MHVSVHAVIDVESWTKRKIGALLRKHYQPCLMESDGYLSVYLVNPDILHDLPPACWRLFVDVYDSFTAEWLRQSGIHQLLEERFLGKALTEDVLADILDAVAQQLLAFEETVKTTYIEQLEARLIQALCPPILAVGADADLQRKAGEP